MPRTIAHTVDKRSLKKRKSDFLKAMEETASVRRACMKAKIPRRTVYEWRGKDEEFEKDFQNSRIIAADALEDEAVRRAFEGYLKPVYQGGNKVGTIREFSDTLLVMLLKGNLPEKYKDRFSGELSGPGGRPIKTHHTKDEIDWEQVPTEVLQALYNARKPSNG
jgi:hypothetical protein